MLAATHSGKFHADDVLAWALIKEFLDSNANLIRTRDEEKIKQADIVFDVGGIFDEETMRFDHHQSSYQGEFSSAGMVLHWLKRQQHMSESLFYALKSSMVDYVDDVDNGRTLPDPKAPCFAQFVDTMGSGCSSLEEFDIAFHNASQFAQHYIQSTKKKILVQEQNKDIVLAEMHCAKEEKRNYLLFSQYVPWKHPYFQADGETHPTEFIIFPNLQKKWQVVAIPPKQNSFAQKKSLPKQWAGLRDEELSNVVGVSGAIFCHKNRFIAIFDSLQNSLSALKKWNIIP